MSLYFWRFLEEKLLSRTYFVDRDLRTSWGGALIFLALTSPGIPLTAQLLGGVNDPAAASGTTSPMATLPSATLQPALDVLKQALAGINVDKWKASSAVRDDAESNLRSIQRDVEMTLTPLLAAGDAAPSSTAKTLPAYRNVEALYDVVLRLEAAGQLAAPRDQASALQQALADLNDARRALGDQLQQDAEGQDRQIVRLQAALKAIPPPLPPPAPVVCTPPPTLKKKKAAKASSTGASSSAAPSH
jgi:hypothetical protein